MRIRFNLNLRNGYDTVLQQTQTQTQLNSNILYFTTKYISLVVCNMLSLCVCVSLVKTKLSKECD